MLFRETTDYWHSDTFQHALAGDDVFAAVRMRMERDEQEFEEWLEGENEADSARKQIGKLQAIRKKLARYWGSERPQVGHDYERKYNRKSKRKPIAETLSDLRDRGAATPIPEAVERSDRVTTGGGANRVGAR